MQTLRLPPSIDTEWLFAALKDQFPEHKQAPKLTAQLRQLIEAYCTWWILMSTYPDRRIVAIAPVWLVRQVHAEDYELFIPDCLEYLGRIPQKEDLWGGAMDFVGTHQTACSIEELGLYVSLPWEPIVRVASGTAGRNLPSLH